MYTDSQYRCQLCATCTEVFYDVIPVEVFNVKVYAVAPQFYIQSSSCNFHSLHELEAVTYSRTYGVFSEQFI